MFYFHSRYFLLVSQYALFILKAYIRLYTGHGYGDRCRTAGFKLAHETRATEDLHIGGDWTSLPQQTYLSQSQLVVVDEHEFAHIAYGLTSILGAIRVIGLRRREDTVSLAEVVEEQPVRIATTAYAYALQHTVASIQHSYSVAMERAA